MSALIKDVVIIGAGLAGCSLALALQAVSIPVRIYESRTSNAPELTSGVILTPNGLDILQKLGVYDRIKDDCWLGEYRTYVNDLDQVTRKALVAGKELYGFANHRVWRRVLLLEMKNLLAEKGVQVSYECKFDGVLGEDPDDDGDDDVNGVRFRVNGREERTDMLIGADGIFSSVRKYLAPDVVPEYTGVVGVIAHINRSAVEWPTPQFEKQCTIQGKPGALVLMPEVKDGSEIMVAMQVKHPNQTREEWEILSKDREFMVNFFRKDYDRWHDTARKIIDAITEHPETLYLWPYLKVPTLDKMYSAKTGRVILVGDAAHAIPPSSGQGVNQALEDIWSLTQLLTSGKERQKALQFWQELRQKRIDAVLDWTINANNVQRMPESERMRIIKERQIEDPNVVESFDDMRWLYRPTTDLEIKTWIERN